MESTTFRLVGVSPLLMHSCRGSDPLDPDVKEHKKLTSNRKKTDEIHDLIARSEWALGLYYDEKIGPYLPTMNIRASLIGGAKFKKLGATVKRSTLVTEAKARLEYDGSRDRNELYEEGFVNRMSCGVGQSRIMRTRPEFPEWSCEMELHYDDEQIQLDQVKEAFETAGKLIGIGDFRPECGGMYGRYRVEL